MNASNSIIDGTAVAVVANKPVPPSPPKPGQRFRASDGTTYVIGKAGNFIRTSPKARKRAFGGASL